MSSLSGAVCACATLGGGEHIFGSFKSKTFKNYGTQPVSLP